VLVPTRKFAGSRALKIGNFFEFKETDIRRVDKFSPEIPEATSLNEKMLGRLSKFERKSVKRTLIGEVIRGLTRVHHRGKDGEEKVGERGNAP